MKSIDTLVEDIYKTLDSPHTFHQENVDKFTKLLSAIILEKLNKGDHTPTLRMSNLGTTCDRELWYKMNTPELAEKLPPEVRMKFLFGDILETLLLFLAEEAGHTVEGAQDTVELNGVKGHRDAIIDGTLVDCKSASTYSYKKFKDHLTYAQDSFGYLDQLQSYLQASQNDPLLKNKDEAAFLVIDKTLGHIVLDKHPKASMDYNMVVEMKRDVIKAKEPPPRGYEDEYEGLSGNRALGTKCSYCAFKKQCWPGLRTFLYSKGPEFLTHVAKLPRVQEIETPGPKNAT